MGVLRVKNARVTFAIIRPAGFRILAALDDAAKSRAFDLTISNGTEGHDPDDPHTLGEAYDLSVEGLGDGEIGALHAALGVKLGPAFTVLYEVPQMPLGPLAAIAYVNAKATGPHLHIQRRRNTVFPPQSGGTSAGVRL